MAFFPVHFVKRGISRFPFASIFVVLVLSLSPWSAVAADDSFGSFQQFLAGTGSLYPGLPGNLAIEEKVNQQFADSGFAHGAIRFRAPAFLSGKTSLQSGKLGKTFRLLPMHPSLMRPGNFTSRDFRAPLVYLGSGTVADLARVDGVDLKGAIALMDFNCGQKWQSFLRFGVRGFIFIGQETYQSVHLKGKVYASEVSVPRFFIDAESGHVLKAAAAKNGLIDTVRIQAEPSRWENRDLRDLWVFIPGKDADLQKEVFLFTAPIDANSVVPEMAYGAQTAGNLYLLLQLLEDFRKKPPARSVMLVAVNAHTQHYLGERMLGWHLLALNSDVEEMRNQLAGEIRAEKVYAQAYAKLDVRNPDPEIRKKNEEMLIRFRTMEDHSTGRPISIKEPLVAMVKREVNLLKGEKVHIQRSSLSKEEKKRRFKEINDRYKKYVDVLILFNKVGARTTLSKIAEKPEELKILAEDIDEIRTRYQQWSTLNQQDLDRNSANSAIREILQGRRVKMAFSLDLTWASDQVGFFSATGNEGDKWAHRFGVHSTRIARKLDAAMGLSSPIFLDTMTNYGGLPEAHFFPAVPSDIGISYFHACRRTPALSLRNCFVDFGRKFSPVDTLDRLSKPTFDRLTGYLPRLFRRILAAPGITASGELPVPRATRSWSILLKTFKFDRLAAAVIPQIPVPGSTLLVYNSIPLRPLTNPILDGDVVNAYTRLTDQRAAAIIYDINRDFSAGLSSMAFHYDPDFVTVDHTLDFGTVHDKVSSNLIRTPQRVLALFPCHELPIWERNDPTRISFSTIRLDDFLILEGRNNTKMRRYAVSGAGAHKSSKIPLISTGPAAVYIEKNDTVKMVADGRLNLNAADAYPSGVGYETAQELGPDFFYNAARDVRILNKNRLKNLRGVTNEMVNSLLAQGEKQLGGLEKEKAGHHYLAYLRSLYLMLGAETKAYAQIAGITNDMLAAVVFYMALLLPFCFFVQKLLFKFVKIESQMAAFAVLFVVTFLVFRVIHPAFRIAQAPAAIFIAFVMLTLGGFVIYILYSRFEGEMQMLFMTYSGVNTAEVGYSTVGQKALLIGVNNMKRRRIRTLLTTTTIVLVTFTMLAFSSVSKKMSPTFIPVSKNAKYTGIFFQWPGNSCMDEATLRSFKELFSGSARIVTRRWLVPERTGDWRKTETHPMLAKIKGGKSMLLDAALGLSMADDGFLERMPILRGGRYFSSGHAREVMLSASAAKLLDLDPAEVARGKVSLLFLGHSFKVVGLVDDERFRAIKDLNGYPLLPIKKMAKQNTPNASSAASAMATAATRDDSGIVYVSTAALIFMPEGTAADFGGKPFSISLRFPDSTSIWSIIDKILTVTQAKFFAASTRPFSASADSKRTTSAGVYYVGSGYKTSIGGLASLIIPLLIAATIILNTMLGAVYERKSEIAVYNAIGLNPTHIGMFFLAEAFVYSVIGSVGGYLIGQCLSLMLIHFNIVQGVNLNFSSFTVVYVIVFTIGVVMLSTLYPAVVATRAAVPSGKRKWSLPPHSGNEMKVVFPFIYQPTIAIGIMGYLDEYFSRFSEASIGDLIANREEVRIGRDDQGRETNHLRFDIALAPFDLGVTQKVDFTVAFDPKVDNYRMTMVITRVSGQDSNWVTTNKPFLEKLRKHMMQWRNLDATQHALYVQHARQLFTLDEEPAEKESISEGES